MGDGFGRVTHHNEYYLSDGSVSFLTGNTLFKVHKSFFERESELFRNQFVVTSEDDPLVGTDARPFTLDVTADEFSQLLWVWYDRAYSYHQQSKANWVVILRLATRWSFPKIKDLALRELDIHGLSPAERISIYNTHGIEDDDRLLDSYVELCKSPVLPSAADGHLLQMETLINILQAREDAQRRAIILGHESPTSASLGDETLREIVSKFFKKGGLDPRSDGVLGSTGSGFQASHLNGNGELHQRHDTSAPITIGAPQVPGRKAPSNSGPSHQANSSSPANDERKGGEQGNQAENSNPLMGEGKDTTKITQDKEREEKEKDAEREAKEMAEKQLQEKEKEEKKKKERQAEKEEKERLEKAQKAAEEQKARRRKPPRGN